MMKQYMGLRFKTSQNEAKLVIIFKWVENKVGSGFKIRPSQEWSYKWFSLVKWVKTEVQMVHMHNRV